MLPTLRALVIVLQRSHADAWSTATNPHTHFETSSVVQGGQTLTQQTIQPLELELRVADGPAETWQTVLVQSLELVESPPNEAGQCRTFLPGRGWVQGGAGPDLIGFDLTGARWRVCALQAEQLEQSPAPSTPTGAHSAQPRASTPPTAAVTATPSLSTHAHANEPAEPGIGTVAPGDRQRPQQQAVLHSGASCIHGIPAPSVQQPDEKTMFDASGIANGTPTPSVQRPEGSAEPAASASQACAASRKRSASAVKDPQPDCGKSSVRLKRCKFTDDHPVNAIRKSKRSTIARQGALSEKACAERNLNSKHGITDLARLNREVEWQEKCTWCEVEHTSQNAYRLCSACEDVQAKVQKVTENSFCWDPSRLMQHVHQCKDDVVRSPEWRRGGTDRRVRMLRGSAGLTAWLSSIFVAKPTKADKQSSCKAHRTAAFSKPGSNLEQLSAGAERAAEGAMSTQTQSAGRSVLPGPSAAQQLSASEGGTQVCSVCASFAVFIGSLLSLTAKLCCLQVHQHMYTQCTTQNFESLFDVVVTSLIHNGPAGFDQCQWSTGHPRCVAKLSRAASPPIHGNGPPNGYRRSR